MKNVILISLIAMFMVFCTHVEEEKSYTLKEINAGWYKFQKSRDSVQVDIHTYLDKYGKLQFVEGEMLPGEQVKKDSMLYLGSQYMYRPYSRSWEAFILWMDREYENAMAKSDTTKQ